MPNDLRGYAKRSCQLDQPIGRSGRPEECFAQCDVVRLGGRVALVTVRVWQRSPELPIAVARGHFLLATRESALQTVS